MKTHFNTHCTWFIDIKSPYMVFSMYCPLAMHSQYALQNSMWFINKQFHQSQQTNLGYTVLEKGL